MTFKYGTYFSFLLAALACTQPMTTASIRWNSSLFSAWWLFLLLSSFFYSSPTFQVTFETCTVQESMNKKMERRLIIIIYAKANSMKLNLKENIFPNKTFPNWIPLSLIQLNSWNPPFFTKNTKKAVPRAIWGPTRSTQGNSTLDILRDRSTSCRSTISTSSKHLPCCLF